MKSNIIINSVEFIYCACGCGFTTWKYDSRGRERHFIKGHALIGKIGENSNGWKYDDVTVRTIHRRVEQILKKPELCEMCGLVPPDDLSNKDHKYSLTNLKDWWYLCTPCHLIFDGLKRDPKTGRFIKRR